MIEEKGQLGTDPVAGDSGVIEQEAAEPTAPPEPREPMPVIESRFMLVDLAALRTKQLRRGASPRVSELRPGDETGTSSKRKLERIAVAELDEGLIVYDLPGPDWKAGDKDRPGGKKGS
jgi:DNA-directed RNA polymerase subunit K/omega